MTCARAVITISSVGVSSVTERILRPVTGKGPTEPIIRKSARCPVIEKLPTEPFEITARGVGWEKHGLLIMDKVLTRWPYTTLII